MRACVMGGSHPGPLPCLFFSRDSAGGLGPCPRCLREPVSELHPASQEGGRRVLCCWGLGLAGALRAHLHLSDPQPTVSTSTRGRWPVAGGIGQVSPGSPTGLSATRCPQWVGVAGLGGGLCCPEPCRRRSERQRDSERRATPIPGLPGGSSYLVCLWIPRVAQPYKDPQATSCSPGSVCSPVKWTLIQYN